MKPLSLADALPARVPHATPACTPAHTSRSGALLIHGLGGTDHDFGAIRRRLAEAGFETHAVCLPGHGTAPGDLSSIHAKAWIDDVTAKYRELAGQYDTLHVVGMCMGALIAALVCARERHRNGSLVVLAAPVYLDGWSLPWYRILRHVLYHVPLLCGRMKVRETEPYGIRNPQVRRIVKARFARGDSFHYAWVPLACIREVDRLRRWLRRQAAYICCPTLIMHAREDELTSLRSASMLHRSIPDSRLVVLENSYHMICVDNDRERVTRGVLNFLDAGKTGAII